MDGVMDRYVRVVIRQHGAPDVLGLEKFTLPEPAPDEVRVKVLAAGVGYSDIMAQRGGYPLAPALPFTPGYDFTGVVEKVGARVQGIEPGQRVAALNPRFGCYAQYVCVPACLLVPFPATLDPAEVCSLVLNYLTAHCILHRKARLQTGQTVLVHSAAGGVGSALVQLCGLAGVNVLGTASAGKHALLRELGAIPIDYKTQDFVTVVRAQFPDGVDAAFDPIGGAHLRRSYKTVRKGGKVVCYGFAGDQYGGLLPMVLGVLQMGYLNLLPDGKRVSLCALPGEVKKHNHWYRQTLAHLIALLEQEKIKPVIGARVPLADASRAHDLIERAAVTGKVILLG